jgi:hypothetical protein
VQLLDAEEMDYSTSSGQVFSFPPTKWQGKAPCCYARCAVQYRGGAADDLPRESVVVVALFVDGLIKEPMRWPDELREPSEYFDQGRATQQMYMVDLAVKLVEKKSGAF